MIAEPLPIQDIEPTRRSGVVLSEISGAKREWERKNRRPPSLSAREALVALHWESTLVAVAASNLSSGMELTDDDYERLWNAHIRIAAIADEFAR